MTLRSLALLLIVLLLAALAFLGWDYWRLDLGEITPAHLLELLGGVVLALALLGLLLLLVLYAERDVKPAKRPSQPAQKRPMK